MRPDCHVLTRVATARECRESPGAILASAVANGLATLDTFGRLSAEPAPRSLFDTHYITARGNAIIAHQVVAAMPALLNR